MKVNARCHCGQLSLTAQIDSTKVFVCCCTDCQKLSASAFRVVVPALPGSVSVRGEAQHYTKVADTGNRRVQGFCPVCGSGMYSKTEGDQPSYVLRLGVLEQACQLKPSFKLWQNSQWPWTEALSQVAGCQRQELF
jgi:hypothetical protein